MTLVPFQKYFFLECDFNVAFKEVNFDISFHQDEFKERPAIGSAIGSIANYQATIQQVTIMMLRSECFYFSSFEF